MKESRFISSIRASSNVLVFVLLNLQQTIGLLIPQQSLWVQFERSIVGLRDSCEVVKFLNR